jgi:histidinol-phosphatase (PHP family)
VLSGVELGNPHEFGAETAKLLAENQLDITIGSLHHLYGINIHTPECFSGRDPYTVIEDYFLELARMSALANFKILGHFDRIFVQPAKMGIPFDPAKLEGSIRTALFTIIKRGQILELNTKNFSYEPQWILVMLTLLRWYRQMGGCNIVVNSDAHRREELGRNFELARIVLKAAGFRTKDSMPAAFPATNLAGLSEHADLAGL